MKFESGRAYHLRYFIPLQVSSNKITPSTIAQGQPVRMHLEIKLLGNQNIKLIIDCPVILFQDASLQVDPERWCLT